MNRTLASASVVFMILSGVARAADPVSIYVGPQLRDGFMDVDAGIRDSIRDVQQEIRQTQELRLLGARDDASIVLIVVGRGAPSNGSIGVASTSVVNGTGIGFGFTVPSNVPTITTVLSTGHYSKVTQSESQSYRGAAKVVVQDVLAWLEANRPMLATLK